MKNLQSIRKLKVQALSILLTFVWLLKPIHTSDKDNTNSYKYQSYLQFPRISFAGRFKADVATGNNPSTNFDNDNFFTYDRQGEFKGGKNQWNPDGTGNFILLDCYVTSACLVDGKCTENSSEDKICGTVLTDSGLSSFAKIVDIDTAFQSVPEIWALKIRIPGFFEGEVKPSPLQFYWQRRSGEGDAGAGGIYQSTIANIKWSGESHSSAVIKQMLERMQNHGGTELSIAFTLDMYKTSGTKDFATGRILGTIGVLGSWAPQVSVWGRSLAPIFPLKSDDENNENNKKHVHTNHAPFVIDKNQRKLHVSILNSLTTLEDGSTMQFPYGTKIGYFLNTKGAGQFLYPAEVSKESLGIIADFSSFNLSHINQKLGGILDIDVSQKQLEILSHTPLSVFQIKGDKVNLFMQESKDGLLVRSFGNWVYRLENGQKLKHKLFVTKFGKPCQGVTISVSPNDNSFDFIKSIGKKEPRPFTTLLKSTDENGLANFVLPTRSSNNYKRVGIDGNLEGYIYTIVKSSMSAASMFSLDRMIVARVFHNHSYSGELTWTDNIRPIFQQYANMFPVMSNRGFDMGNYFDVIAHKEILLLSMSLPKEHPSYMPVTRDVSEVKKGMILTWLRKPVPSFGDPMNLLTKHYLLSLLQTALEVTHATIPPLLTALWSIKDHYKRRTRNVLLKVFSQEKIKIHLLSRIILSLGGRPKLFHGTFVLNYPSVLPDGINQELLISLAKLSKNLLRNGIIACKRPEMNKLHVWSRNVITTYTNSNKRRPFLRMRRAWYKHKCRLAVKAMLENSIEYTIPEQKYNQYMAPRDRKIFKYHSSVDNFLNHILIVLSFITDCGSNAAIFRSFKSKLFATFREGKVYDYFSAVNDLQRIIMITNGNNGRSQYTLLRSLVEEKCNWSSVRFWCQIPKEMKGHSSQSHGVLQSRNRLPKHSIWPIIANPKIARYHKGKGRSLAEAFNDVYTFYLISYEKMLNAVNRESRRHYQFIAKELERAFHILGPRLMQIPLQRYGNKHVGPNMAPTYEINFEIARTRFLEQIHIIKKLKKVNWNIDHYIKIKAKYAKDQYGKKAESRQSSLDEEEDINEEHFKAYDVYQPFYKNPYIDIHALYYDLPIL